MGCTGGRSTGGDQNGIDVLEQPEVKSLADVEDGGGADAPAGELERRELSEAAAARNLASAKATGGLDRLVRMLKLYYGKMRRYREKAATSAELNAFEAETSLGRIGESLRIASGEPEVGSTSSSNARSPGRKCHASEAGGYYVTSPPSGAANLHRVLSFEPVRPTSMYAVHKQLRRNQASGARFSDPGTELTDTRLWERRHKSRHPERLLPLLSDTACLESSLPDICGAVPLLQDVPSFRLPKSCGSPAPGKRPEDTSLLQLCDADDVFLESPLPSRDSSVTSSGVGLQPSNSFRSSYFETPQSPADRNAYVLTSPSFRLRRETDSEAVTNLGNSGGYDRGDLEIIARDIGLILSPNSAQPAPLRLGAQQPYTPALVLSSQGSPRNSARFSHPTVRLRRLRSTDSCPPSFYDEPRPVVPVRPGSVVFTDSSGRRVLRQLHSMPARLQSFSEIPEYCGVEQPRRIVSMVSRAVSSDADVHDEFTPISARQSQQ